MKSKYCLVCYKKLTRWSVADFPFSLFKDYRKKFKTCQQCRDYCALGFSVKEIRQYSGGVQR